jgi:hypothetical protein
MDQRPTRGLSRTFVACATVLLATPLLAQSRAVIPDGYASVEGNSAESRPFGFDRCRLSQYLGLRELTGKIRFAQQLTEIAYRRDGTTAAAQTLSRSTTPIWQIRAGNLAQTDINDPDNRFLGPGSGNGGSSSSPDTLKIVFSAKTVNFPALAPATNNEVSPFTIRFKFDAPIYYLGLGLCIDHYVYESRNSTHAYYVDAVRSTVDSGSAKRFGKPCPSTGNRAHAIPSHPGGDPVELLLFDGPQKPSTAIGFLGVSDQQLGALPLPLGLAGLGLPGCSLYVSQEIALLVPTFSNGSARLSIPLAADPALAGARWFAQFLVLDDRVSTQLPVALSNGLEITNGTTVGSGAALQASFLYGTSNLANGRYGLRDIGVSLVTEITAQ